MKTTRLTIRSLVCLLLSLSLCVSLVTAAFAESPTELTSDEAISTEASTTESISATEGSATESISATEGTALETSATAEGDAALADEDEDAVTSFEISSSIDNEDFNLVLLIDCSGSMKNTDRSQFVKDAAKMVVDLCDEGGDSKIAVMSFDTSVYNSGFIAVSDGYQRELVKKEISDITYAAGGTDIGNALLSAVQFICGESEDAQKKMIILFTDGYTQDLENKTIEESEAQLQDALDIAIENNCRIFTIGTNYNDSMNENGRVALEGIRDYQLNNGVANSPEELLAIIDAHDQDGMKAVVTEFEKIYATIGERIIHEGNLVVESPNISEANIIIAAPDGVSEVIITAPSGNSVNVDLNGGETFLEGTKIVFKAGKSYQLIKLVEPIATGTWILNVADKQSEPILNYTWMLTEKTEITLTLEQASKDSALATIRPKNIDADNIHDFFDSLTEKSIVVTKKGETEGVTLNLDYNATAASLTAFFPIESGSAYTVTAKVSDGYFVRTCTGTIRIRDKWKGGSADIGTIYALNWFSKTLDLTDTLGQGVKRYYSVNGGEELAEFEIHGNTLTIHSLSSGTEEIRISSLLEDGSETELVGQLRVISPIIPLLGILLVLAFILFLVHAKRQKRSLRSKLFLNFEVSLGEDGKYALPEVFVPSKRVFSMYELLLYYRRDLVKPEWAKVLDKKVFAKKSRYYRILKSNKFTVRADEQSFVYQGTVYKRHDTDFSWTTFDGVLSVTFKY